MKIRNKIIIICGAIMIFVGFGIGNILLTVLYPPTEPPYMRPVSELESIFLRFYYWSYVGVVGIPVILIGAILTILKK